MNQSGGEGVARPRRIHGTNGWSGHLQHFASGERPHTRCPVSDENPAQQIPGNGASKTRPWPEAPGSAVGTLSVSTAAQPYVRLFKKQGTELQVFRPVADTLSADELLQGVELAIEGKDIVRDASVWDGFADITFTVQVSSSAAMSDTVRLRLAPLVTQHHLSRPVWVLATIFLGDPTSMVMLDDLSAAVTAAGIAKPLAKLDLDDQWTQDLFETSTMSMPAPEFQKDKSQQSTYIHILQMVRHIPAIRYIG